MYPAIEINLNPAVFNLASGSMAVRLERVSAAEDDAIRGREPAPSL